MLKKFLGVFLLVALLVSCNKEDDASNPQPLPSNDSITILSYLIANNNLDDALSFNIAIMYDGLAEMTEPATLLVYWDGRTSIGANKSKHLILKYETDGKGKINGRQALDTSAKLKDILNEAIILKEYKEQVSTDKHVMSMVLQDMAAFSPTDRLGLVIGSHGSSWYHTIATRALGYDGSLSNSILFPDTSTS